MADSIALIPLDSRPVSLLLPAALGGLAGYNVLSPSRRDLGHLHQQAHRPRVSQWLINSALPRTGTIVASTDLLAYGGLIFSREHKIKTTQAIKNLHTLRRARKQSKGLTILAFGVILRDSISVRNDDDFRLWKKLASGKGEYPDWFRKLRKRNLAVNRALVELAAEGVVDFAALGKEDTAPGNPFGDEIEELRQYAQKLGVQDRVLILNGADELPLLLLARRINSQLGQRPRIMTDTLGSDFLKHTPLFESQPLGKTLKQQLRLAGARLRMRGSYDLRLLLHCPARKQKDLFALQLENPDKKLFPARGRGHYRRLCTTISREKKPVAVADLAHANGADPELMIQLLRGGNFLKLAAYASWNTASNTLGTVVAFGTVAAALRASGRGGKSTAGRHVTCLMDRLAEDWLYQSAARARVAGAADNPHNFKDPAAANNALKRELTRELNRTSHEYLSDRTLDTFFLPKNKSIIISRVALKHAALPWNRLFEADIRTAPEFEILEMTD